MTDDEAVVAQVRVAGDPCSPDTCGSSPCSYDEDYGAYMRDEDRSYGDYTAAELLHCSCLESHGECEAPGCALPRHDASAKWGFHRSNWGNEWR